MRKFKSRQALFLLTILLFLVVSGVQSAFALNYSGRFGVWSYVRDDSVDRVQVVPLLSLNVHKFGGGDWNFESTLRGFAEYQNGYANSSGTARVHRAVLIWKPEASKWDIRLGQQWVTEGIGRGNVLGLWSNYKFNRKTDLRVFGGSRLNSSLSLDQENPDGGWTGGLNLRTRFGKRQIGLSYFYVSKDGDVMFNGLGLDYHCTSLKDLTMRARLHMNLEQSAIETGQITAYWQTTGKLMLSADLRTQSPRIFEDSFFATFLEESKTNSARLGAFWEFDEDVYLTGMGYTIFTEEDMLYKVRAGIGDEKGEIGYTHWLSAGEGDMDGFYGQTRYDIKQFEVSLGFDYSRGSNSEIRPNTEAQVIYGGLDWSITRMINLGGRIEHLKNQYHSEDWRALFSLVTHFRSAVRGEQ